MTHSYIVVQYKNTLQILIKDNYLIIKLLYFNNPCIIKGLYNYARTFVQYTNESKCLISYNCF